MALTRPALSTGQVDAACQSDPEVARECAFAAEGSGYGSAITIGAKLGLHPF